MLTVAWIPIDEGHRLAALLAIYIWNPMFWMSELLHISQIFIFEDFQLNDTCFNWSDIGSGNPQHRRSFQIKNSLVFCGYAGSDQCRKWAASFCFSIRTQKAYLFFTRLAKCNGNNINLTLQSQAVALCILDFILKCIRGTWGEKFRCKCQMKDSWRRLTNTRRDILSVKIVVGYLSWMLCMCASSVINKLQWKLDEMALVCCKFYQNFFSLVWLPLFMSVWPIIFLKRYGVCHI